MVNYIRAKRKGEKKTHVKFICPLTRTLLEAKKITKNKLMLRPEFVAKKKIFPIKF